MQGAGRQMIAHYEDDPLKVTVHYLRCAATPTGGDNKIGTVHQ